MTDRHRRFLDGLPPIKEDPWAVVRANDKVGTLTIIEFTHHQGGETFYGWINGEVMEAAFRSTRKKQVVERFESREAAEAAISRAWIAWESHYGAVTKAREELRVREKAREDALWKAVRGA